MGEGTDQLRWVICHTDLKHITAPEKFTQDNT